MLAFALPVLALFAATISATPILSVRQTGAACTSLGDGSTDSPAYNFTLAAYNLSLPNANSTGAPLVLGYGRPVTSPAASEWAICTYASWGSDNWPYFTLSDGVLTPIGGSEESGMEAYDYTIDAGAEVAFLVVSEGHGASPVSIYCAAVDDEGYAVLAVNNDASNFSLCKATTSWANTVLVYEAEANNTYYDYSTCYSVQVNIIPYDS